MTKRLMSPSLPDVVVDVALEYVNTSQLPGACALNAEIAFTSSVSTNTEILFNINDFTALMYDSIGISCISVCLSPQRM